MKVTTIVMLLTVCIITIRANGQIACNVKVEYSIEKADQSGLHSITLEPDQMLTNVHIQLADLYSGKIVKESNVTSLSSKQVVFLDVKPSLYTIYIKYEGCDKLKSIGGMQGIKVGDL